MDDELARRLLAASPDGLWLLGVDGTTRWANARVAELLGRDPDDLDAASIFDCFDEQGRLDLTAHLSDMAAGHPGRDNDEVFFVRPDGSLAWTLVSWRPVLDEQGTTLGYLHRLTEYTDRRALLDRLSERESELATAQEIARLGSWSYDVATDHSTWSPELYRIYDLDPADFQPDFEGYLDRAHPEDRAQVRAIIEDCMRDGDSYSYQSRIVTPSGQIRWLSSHGVVERDEHGAPVVLHGTCQDVTDLQQAADDAHEARLRLTLLSSIAEAANRSVTLDDALARAHAALAGHGEWRARSLWGRLEGQEAPALIADLTGPDEPPPDPEAAARVPGWETGAMSDDASPRPGWRTVWLPVQCDGTTLRLVELEGAVDRVDDAVRVLLKQIAGTLGRVAEREQAAVQLAAARDAAMAASAHKSAFLATMSHEIRTPMNGVIGLNDLLLRTDLDQRQRRLAEGLRGAGLTLLSLLNDILDLSKIESGAVELEHAPFEVSHLLDQTATIIAAPAQEKRLELVLTCDPAVPPVLLGDRARLGQVLTNLASNAVKFTERGEVVVELSLDEAVDPQGRVLLRGEVRDTGIGIGPDAATLFEAFTQADRSTTRTHGGTGLGLTISRRLVQDMGGSIGADERPDGGSVFWFVVPAEAAPEGSGTTPTPLPGRRALVVDDNASAATALARQLGAWGLDVRTVDSAREALGLLLEAAGTEGAFDLALIDLHMPGVDGFALARAVRRRDELVDLPLILLTDDPSSYSQDMTAIGFAGVIDKPLRISELHRAILSAALDTAELQIVTAASQQSTPAGRIALTVLVVEDNPVNQLVAQGMLENLGCSSSVANNGEEAVAALAPGHGFDLVLMDCRMPRLDGYAATELIRARESGPRVPIVAMTASALAGERDRCLAVGMDDFLTKPVDSASLARVVTRWSARTAGPGDAPPAPVSATQGVDGAEGAEGAVGAERPPGDRPVLDPERAEMLSELVRDGVDFFERTRTSFLSRIESTLAGLRQARDDHDLPRVAAIAHQLRGSALNIGLTRLGDAAAGLERAAEADDPDATAVGLAALEAAAAEGVGALVAHPSRDRSADEGQNGM